MAKQPNQPFPGDENEPRTPKKPPQLPKDEDSGVIDAEVVADEPATPKAPPRRSATPTMIGQPDPDADAPRKAIPTMPNLSLDNDDEMVVEAVAAEEASEVLEVSPVSDADEGSGDIEMVEAVPASDVVAAMPVSDVVLSDVVSAAPVSDVAEAEAVLGDEAEEIDEAMPVSAALSDALVAEAVEVEEPSSATRHSESVFGDEPLGKGSQGTPAKSESAVFAAEVSSDVTDIGAEPSGLDPESSMIQRGGVKVGDSTDEEDVLTAEEAEPVQAESGVLWDDAEAASKVKPAAPVDKTADFGQTVAFEPGKGGADIDEFLVTEEEAESADVIDLGEMPTSKKNGSTSGYDPVAEALESGLLDDAAEEARVLQSKSSPSVEFDDLLTEEADEASEVIDTNGPTDVDDLADAGKGKKLRSKADDAIDEAAEAEVAEMFGDAEETEMVAEAEEAEEAAAFADEPKVKKKGKKDDEEEDDDEPKSKKGKKDKEPAVVKPSYGSRWVGGILVGTMLTAGAVAGVGYFAPEQVKEVMKFSPDYKPEIKKEIVQLSPAGKAKEKLVEGSFQEAFDLVKDAGDSPDILKMRGEARWRLYVQQQIEAKKPLDAKSDEVKAALSDLDMAKDPVAKAQIESVLAAPLMKAELDKLAKVQMESVLLAKQLEASAAAKEQAEKALAAAAKVVADAKFIDDPKDFDAVALQKVLKDLSDKQGVLAAVNKLLEEAKIKDAGDKGVQTVLAAKKAADEMLSAVNKLLEGEKTKDAGAKGVQEIVDARNKTSKDRDELDKTLKAAYQELIDGKLVPADGDPRKQIVEGTKLARQKAESPLAIPLTQVASGLAKLGTGAAASVQRTADLSMLATEAAFYRAREPFIQTPAQKLDAQAALLQNRSNNDPKALAMITREADWVLASKDSSTDAKAKAHYVAGLALRNQAKYAEAKQAIAQAVQEAKTSPWAAEARQSLAELTDPKAYHLPRIEKALAAGDRASALAEIKTALDVIPGNGILLVQRGVIQLQAANGKLTPATQQQIRDDAAAAAKDAGAVAAAAYLVGLLEEELGNLNGAEKQYRAALKSAPAGSEEASKYRTALGRLLLLDRTAAPPTAPAPAEKTSQESLRPVFAHPFATLVAIAVIGQVVDEPEDPAVVARLKETVDLAKELQQSTNPKIKGQGHMLLGQALAKQGKRTEGLKEYTKGLELMFPGLASKDLGKMIDEHPAFQQPDLSNIPNPVLAERHYGQGLNDYWTRQYASAEVQFKKAVELYGHDARYQYFLGLSQLAQKGKAKRDAAFYSFELGARLETQQLPSVNEINFSLERVQGELRTLVNRFRSKAYDVKR